LPLLLPPFIAPFYTKTPQNVIAEDIQSGYQQIFSLWQSLLIAALE
jgi:hypothetical protein